MGKLAVIRVLIHGKIDRSVVYNIGIAFIDQRADHIDHALNFLRSLRMRRRGAHVQIRHILLAFLNVTLGNNRSVHAFLICLLNDFVVYVGEVRYVVHFVPFILEVTAHRVEHDHRSRVADMNQVVNRRTADIHADLARRNRLELFQCFCFGIINPHFILSPFLQCAVRQRNIRVFLPGLPHRLPGLLVSELHPDQLFEIV